ncbi:hypothetical protein, partial [Pantoea sp. GM_Pan_4]|uniref:hypothetical protein n=1 Tax=Pantoea sp. GM_Pan_4 TaxID=2937389 RepID=UPI00226B6002
QLDSGACDAARRVSEAHQSPLPFVTRLQADKTACELITETQTYKISKKMHVKCTCTLMP